MAMWYNEIMDFDWYEISERFLKKCKRSKDQKHIGLFDSETEAARAYDDFNLSIDPEFTNLNFPPLKVVG